MDDRELVALVLRGNTEAFGTLIHTYHRLLVLAAYQMTEHAEDAEDLAQETLVEAYKHLRSLNDTGKFRGWLFTILRHKCQRHQQRQRIPEIPLDAVADTLPAPPPVEDGKMADWLQDLPLPYREAIAARFLCALSYAEIAQLQGTTVDVVRVRLHRAKQRLADIIRHDDDTEVRTAIIQALSAVCPISATDLFTHRVIQGVKPMPQSSTQPSSPSVGKAAAGIKKLITWKVAAGLIGGLALTGGVIGFSSYNRSSKMHIVQSVVHDTAVPASTWAPSSGVTGQSKEQIASKAAGIDKEQWVTEVGGQLSEPIVGTNDLLYVTSTDGHLYALETHTGQIRWSGPIPDASDRKMHFRVTKPPMISYAPMLGAHGMLFCGSLGQDFYAFDALTGERWNMPTPGPTGSVGVDYKQTVAPDGTLYAAFGNKLCAYERNTGKMRWTYEGSYRDAAGRLITCTIFTPPAIGSDGTIYINAGSLYALDQKTGKLRWTWKPSGDELCLAGPIIGPDDTVYVSDFTHSLYAINGMTGILKWSNSYSNRQIQQSPIIDANGTLYFISNCSQLHAVDGATGTERWRTQPVNSQAVSSLTIGADGKLYAAGVTMGIAMTVHTVLFTIDTQTGNILTTSPVLESGRTGGATKVVIGPDGTIYTSTYSGKVYALR